MRSFGLWFQLTLMVPRLKGLKKKSRIDDFYFFSFVCFVGDFLYVFLFVCLWGILVGLVFVVVVLSEKRLGKKTKRK